MRRKRLFGGVVTAMGAILVSVGAVRAGFDEGLIDVSFGGRDATPVGKAVVGNEGDKWNAPEGHQAKSKLKAAARVGPIRWSSADDSTCVMTPTCTVTM
jgi:hypothetical protein